MNDIVAELNAIRRRVATGRLAGGAARTVELRRTYDAPVDDVWEAITSPERIARWFLPVTGDLRVGGRYQTQGNAGGEILRCEPPRLLHITWVMSPADASEVLVRLSPGPDDATVLELEHTAVVDAERWSTFGPGAVGVGWDMTLLGLAWYLDGRAADLAERGAWPMSEEGRTFATRSAAAWGAAHEDSGAGAEEAATAVKNTTEFYAPQP